MAIDGYFDALWAHCGRLASVAHQKKVINRGQTEIAPIQARRRLLGLRFGWLLLWRQRRNSDRDPKVANGLEQNALKELAGDGHNTLRRILKCGSRFGRWTR